MPRSAAITGLGFISSIGSSRAEVASSLRHARSGIVNFDFSGNPRVAIKVGAPVPGFAFPSPSWREWSWPAAYSIPRETVRGLAPHGVYAFCAVEQALADAGLSAAEVSDPATGLFCASVGSTYMIHHYIDELVTSQYERGHPMSVVSSIAGTLNFNLAAHYHVTGAVTGFVSACTSASHALGFALDEIRLGRQQRMIVVGAEDMNAATAMPFAAMRALSTHPDPTCASRPFDVERDGFVPTGGATALILEAPELALARGAHVYAEMIGWGQAADGYNVATSHPEGLGLQRAVGRALKDAGIGIEAVDYINAHATSTPAGDRSEALALRALLGPKSRTLVSSTKGLTGHGLSMAGALEAGICALTFGEGFVPGNPTLRNPDPSCEGLNLPVDPVACAPGIVLNNSSGFGGSNVSQVFRAWSGKR